jgi:ABC-2 type transport system ATP-binding protein
MSSDHVLAVRGLSKVYGKKLFGRGGFRALDGVDLEVGRGSVFGLLGPNGAGKTTLVKCVLDLVRGWNGEASILGGHPRDPRVRRRVGFLPEAHRLPPYLTGMQVVLLSAMLQGMSANAARPRARELFEELGLSRFQNAKVRTYSKGMQQRLGLVQAIVHEPELVFLDEPTDGVDPIGRRTIRALVERLKERGATIFLNSHLLMEVEMICDRVVIMHRGKVLREGSVAELTAGSGLVRFELADVPADLAAVVSGIGTRLAVSGNGFEVQADLSQQNALVDRLRAAGIRIQSIEPRRITLEEAFVDLIGAQRGGGAA